MQINPPVLITKVAKLAKYSVIVAILGTVTACKASTDTANDVKVDESAPKIQGFPTVFQLFSCKPDAAAFVAAHRGTHEGSEYPENTLASLQALHAANVKFAEIDIARLKDGTMILWHDGVWERSSNGNGPIAASTWDDSQKLLNKTTDGKLTAYRPSKFNDVLTWAKDRMYLEIDLKSSVNSGEVIKAIRAAGMIEQVVLISYNTEQALELHDLAPEAALSVSIFKPGDKKALETRGIRQSAMTAWTGRGPLTEPLVTSLRQNDIPILAASFFDLDDKIQKSEEFDRYIDFAEHADLVVTDFAFDVQPVLNFTAAQQFEFDACIETLN